MSKEDILTLVSDATKVPIYEIVRQNKRSGLKILAAKRMCMYFIRINTNATNNEILDFLGYSKNPPELSHGIKWVKRKIKLNRDMEFINAYKLVAATLGNLPVVL